MEAFLGCSHLGSLQRLSSFVFMVNTRKTSEFITHLTTGIILEIGHAWYYMGFRFWHPFPSYVHHK